MAGVGFRMREPLFDVFLVELAVDFAIEHLDGIQPEISQVLRETVGGCNTGFVAHDFASLNAGPNRRPVAVELQIIPIMGSRNHACSGSRLTAPSLPLRSGTPKPFQHGLGYERRNIPAELSNLLEQRGGQMGVAVLRGDENSLDAG